MNQVRSRSRKLSFFGASISLLIIGGVVWGIFNRQYIIDQSTVWSYKPSDEVSKIADDVGMSDLGKFYYYASRPKLDSTSNFNEECQRKEQGNAILGCYKDGRIYIYDIDDQRLDGVKEVTAAHEMLHAAYDRLSESEKNRIDYLLGQEASKVSDESFTERMEYYSRNQPGQHYNELHSIIGTEFSDITPELEEYYKKYFNDRQKVVSLHGKYSGKFDELRQGTDSLKSQLEALSVKINNASQAYNNAVASLNSDISNFNSRAQSGDFSSQSEFDNERAALVGRMSKLKQDRANIDNLISQYETKRIEYNKLVDESNSLQQAMDSSLAPAPSM